MNTGRVPPALPTGEPAPRDGRLAPEALDELGNRPFGVYVHVPFCQTRCGYCDFNTYTASELGPSVSRGSYADTVLMELRLARSVLRREVPPVESVFFGGGTPTVLPAEHLGLIVREIGELFGLAPDVEITTEANPESVTPAYFGKLRAAGFTRVSIGMQSAVPHVLDVLDRRHRPGRPEEAVGEARAAGLEHVNLDLIYGTPHETEADWQASLDAAVAAKPDHISAYSLVVEQGTALARQVAQGVVPMPDDDRAGRPLRAGRRNPAPGGLPVVRGVELGEVDCRAVQTQRAVLAQRELVGRRPRRAQPHRRGALVEREAPGARTARCWSQARARRPAARRSTPTPA